MEMLNETLERCRRRPARMSKIKKSFKESGIIESADIFIEDHGLLTWMIYFDFGGAMQGFGGTVLDTFSTKDNRRVGTAAGCDLILQLLNLFGVRSISDIKGREAIAIKRDSGYGAPIIGIAMPDSEKTFFVEEWREMWYPKSGRVIHAND